VAVVPVAPAAPEVPVAPAAPEVPPIVHPGVVVPPVCPVCLNKSAL
jgi:hypothetical protein